MTGSHPQAALLRCQNLFPTKKYHWTFFSISLYIVFGSILVFQYLKSRSSNHKACLKFFYGRSKFSCIINAVIITIISFISLENVLIVNLMC